MNPKASSADCLEGNTDYYRNTDIRIENEETISNSLRDDNQLCIECLQDKIPYGILVARFLKNKGILKDNIKIVEIGGGYGHLMYNLLQEATPKEITMLDINKHLLEKQKSLLKQKANYICDDVFEALPQLKPDLVIANEMIADIKDPKKLIKIIKKTGASAFITEYSCDYKVPEQYRHLYNEPEKHGKPKLIKLEGHHELTPNFNELKQAAESEGFKAEEGSLIEIINLRNDDWIKRITIRPENFMECMMKTFINKLKQFRYLVLTNVH